VEKEENRKNMVREIQEVVVKAVREAFQRDGENKRRYLYCDRA
jgi:hypothetical protein